MTISITDLAKAAIRAADANPDYVYQRLTMPSTIVPGAAIQGCAYFDATGEPSCLFGHAFHELGVDLRGNATTPVTLAVLLEVLRYSGDFTDEDEVERVGHEAVADLHYALTKAQQAQDVGEPWGQAVEPIREWLATYGWPEAKTIDGVEVTKGLRVWDYNLDPATVTGVQSVSHGITWFKTDTGMFDGSRMWVHHPSDGRVPEAVPS
jgi:hypothetical protein